MSIAEHFSLTFMGVDNPPGIPNHYVCIYEAYPGGPYRMGEFYWADGVWWNDSSMLCPADQGIKAWAGVYGTFSDRLRSVVGGLEYGVM